jgi:hypothetical protein
MKNLLIAFVVAASLPFAVAGQNSTDALKPYTAVLQTDGLPLALIVVNNTTAPVLFQPPTLYAIRARANEMTTLYVQGVAAKPVELDTTSFVMEQSGSASSKGTPTSIKNFTKGKVKLGKGDRVDGLLTFERMFNMRQVFTVKHGKDSVDVKLQDTASLR